MVKTRLIAFPIFLFWIEQTENSMTLHLTQKEPILEASNLKKWFPLHHGFFSRSIGKIKAVDDVSFSIQRGETLGLVGESGCGKSTLGQILLQLISPTSGTVLFEGHDISKTKSDDMKALRKKMQIIFQDPFSSLNPRLSVGFTLREALSVHNIVPAKELQQQVELLLETVGLNAFHARRYPHEFSSGQRQRIGIARALAVQPAFIVCDEPVSALDVSIQAQIVNLLLDLRESFHLTYLFISHDLSVVRHIADRTAVMYLGKIVELGPTEEVISNPMHPYAQALISSVPHPFPGNHRERIVLKGDVPSPIAIPAGCPFHPRCFRAIPSCAAVVPQLQAITDGHSVRCLLYETETSMQDAFSAAGSNDVMRDEGTSNT